MDDVFPCSKCGACCRHIAKVLPHFDKGDGVCWHLTGDNLCAIYENRPFICNIDKIYDKHFKGRMERKDFYDITKGFCKIVRELEE